LGKGNIIKGCTFCNQKGAQPLSPIQRMAHGVYDWNLLSTDQRRIEMALYDVTVFLEGTQKHLQSVDRL
jgi:hypothetical protein